MENPDTNPRYWYALYTNSRAEKKVLEQLTLAGIESYLPLKKELKQWSDRKKWVETPIINSYIFVKIAPEAMRDVYLIKGVVAFVNDKGKPAIIPDNEMKAMQLTVNNKLSFVTEQYTLHKGATIRVLSGPLAGVEGEITDIKGETRLHIKISHIGYSLSIDISDYEYEKVM
jgi:transcription antitermination factor NusG